MGHAPAVDTPGGCETVPLTALNLTSANSFKSAWSSYELDYLICALIRFRANASQSVTEKGV